MYEEENRIKEMQPTIIYRYSYIHGGLADFLKYFFHTIDLCSAYGLALRIYVDHPLKDYIEWQDTYDKLCVDSLPEDAYFISRRDANRNFRQLLSGHAYIVLCSLDYFSYNIQFEGLSNELNFRATNRRFTLEDYMRLKIDAVFERPFLCIHVRMGDKYTCILPAVEYCTEDDRSVEETKMHGHISSILEMVDAAEFDVYFISDNVSIKQRTLDAFPALKATTTTRSDDVVLNISYPIEDQDLFRKGLEMSIREFQILRRAYSIYALSYSGFTIMSNHLTLNPEQQLFQLY